MALSDRQILYHLSRMPFIDPAELTGILDQLTRAAAKYRTTTDSRTDRNAEMSHDEGLQLLCGACNNKKGNRTQAELIAALRHEGVISA